MCTGNCRDVAPLGVTCSFAWAAKVVKATSTCACACACACTCCTCACACACACMWPSCVGLLCTWLCTAPAYVVIIRGAAAHEARLSPCAGGLPQPSRRATRRSWRVAAAVYAAEGATLGAPQLATPASPGGHSWLWVARRTLEERPCRPGPRQRPRHGQSRGVHHHTGCYCPDGVTADIWRLALENFPAPRGKMVGPQGVCVP